MGDDKTIKMREQIDEKLVIDSNIEMYKLLAEVSLLQSEGKDEEASALLDKEMMKYQKQLEEMGVSFGTSETSPLDRSLLPENGAVFAADDKVCLKMISSEEKLAYIDVSYECSTMKSFYKDECFLDDLWDGFLKDYTVAVSIYDKNTGAFIGYCSIKDTRKDDWEIAIEISSKYQHQGYGYHALSLFLPKMKELAVHTIYRARIDFDNIASQGLFKKIGAYPDGIGEYLLHGDNLKEFQEENRQYITDEMRKTAEEFCMDAEDILGQVLEYRIDLGSV